MPIYEYQCHNCNEKTEFMQKMGEEPKKTCPHCHEETLEKIISPVGFQLKGSGWYVTDFKNKSEKAKPTEVKKEEAKTEKPTTEVKKSEEK